MQHTVALRLSPPIASRLFGPIDPYPYHDQRIPPMKFAWQANRGRFGPRTCCQRFGTLLQRKGHPTITVRTLFGKISLKSLRLRHCRCQVH
jgi:hypothetical protein